MQNNLRRLFDNLEHSTSPEYRGAPYPPFDPLHINTKRIPDGMRDKYVNSYEDYDEYNLDDEEDIDKYILEWTTQEDFDSEDFEKFIAEVKRCVEYNLNYYNINLYKPLHIKVKAESRSGPAYGSGEEKLVFERDSFIESLDNKDIYYYGFIGGDAGNYFDGDYFEIIRNDDDTFSWQDCELTYNSADKKFKSRRQAYYDAIKAIKPDDGSEFIVRKDPNEIYQLVYPDIDKEDIPEDIL